MNPFRTFLAAQHEDPLQGERAPPIHNQELQEPDVVRPLRLPPLRALPAGPAVRG